MAIDQTERELEVLAIFRQLLGAPQLGPEQNFFEAGGSSLLAARLAARLRTSGVLDVPTSAVFAAPTARALTRYSVSPIQSRYAASPVQSHDDEAPVSTPTAASFVPSSAAERGARQRAAFARLRPTLPHKDAR